MQTKTKSIEKAATTSTAMQDRPEETSAKTPQTFYEKIVERSDVREILTRLARMDEEETR